MNLARLRLEDQLAQVERDLRELEAQVAEGELDTETADRLRSTYEAEAAELRAALSGDDSEVESDPGGSRSRRVAGAVFLLVGAVAVTVAVTQVIEDRPPGGLVTGGIVSDIAATGGRDLSTVTNEELEVVVAQNPDVVPMRLALARRYFEGGEFDKALTHYLEVLDRQDSAEALANVGWMTYLSERADVAAPFVERALALEPAYPQALWYLANIRLFGLGDTAGAIAPLESLLTAPDLPDEIRTEAETMLRTARGTG